MKNIKDHIRDYDFANQLQFNGILADCGNDYGKAKKIALADKNYQRRLVKIAELQNEDSK